MLALQFSLLFTCKVFWINLFYSLTHLNVSFVYTNSMVIRIVWLNMFSLYMSIDVVVKVSVS